MSAEHAAFLDDLIVTLIENFRTLTWFRTEGYDCPDDGPVTATIVDDEGTRHAITRDTMSRGIDVIRRARLAPGSTDPDSAELVNADTGQPLYVSPHNRRRVLAAARDGDGDGRHRRVGDRRARALRAGGVRVSVADERDHAAPAANRRLLAEQTEPDHCTDRGADYGQGRVRPGAGPGEPGSIGQNTRRTLVPLPTQWNDRQTERRGDRTRPDSVPEIGPKLPFQKGRTRLSFGTVPW
jgi:hypothetical protein